MMTNAAIFPCKKDPLPMTIWDLYNNYKGSYAPEEFQRPESWSAKERKAYFLSVLMNRIEGTFVFVDVEIARARVESIDPTDISFTYFSNLLKQITKISKRNICRVNRLNPSTGNFNINEDKSAFNTIH